MSTEQLIKKALKNIQSRFFSGSVTAQRGFFITKEDADDVRKKVTRPIKSMSFLSYLLYLCSGVVIAAILIGLVHYVHILYI